MGLKLFGRDFDSIGSSSSDLLLKTKGQVKVQWGNKFIDLLKDGKVNYPKDEIKKIIEELIDEKMSMQDENGNSVNIQDIINNNSQSIKELKETIDVTKDYFDSETITSRLSIYEESSNNVDVPVSGIIISKQENISDKWEKLQETTGFPTLPDGYIYLKRK